MKTNIELVSYCEKQLGNPYWYGCFGNTATASLLSTKRKQYPSYYDESKYKVGFTQQYGKRVHDCIGLLKGFLWSDTATATPKYNAAQDVSANGMLGKCKESGTIKTMPEIKGLLVFMSGHVGVYIGGGYVIEARGHDYGVVKTALRSRPWTHWGKCPWIEYVETSTAAKVQYFTKYTGTSASIVDALSSIGAKTSLSYRTKIAKANGISGYIGTASQNAKLLILLKAGMLVKPQ